jgi:hypothetical protein
MPSGRHKAAILTEIATVKLLPVLLMIMALCDLTAAQAVPLPRSRPAAAPAAEPPEAPAEEPGPSACRLRLTLELAVAPSLPAVVGPGECGVEDGVRLEAVLLRDKTQVAVTPPPRSFAARLPRRS